MWSHTPVYSEETWDRSADMQASMLAPVQNVSHNSYIGCHPDSSKWLNHCRFNPRYLRCRKVILTRFLEMWTDTLTDTYLTASFYPSTQFWKLSFPRLWRICCPLNPDSIHRLFSPCSALPFLLWCSFSCLCLFSTSCWKVGAPRRCGQTSCFWSARWFG